MAGSVNKVILVGNVGADPEVRTMQSGDKVANFTLATSESWNDKSSGERREKTEWHKIVIFNQGLVKLCENYIRKGTKLFIEGQLETRSWESNGEKKYTTEIVLKPFRGEIMMLGGNDKSGNADSSAAGHAQQAYNPDQFDDENPF